MRLLCRWLCRFCDRPSVSIPSKQSFSSHHLTSLILNTFLSQHQGCQKSEYRHLPNICDPLSTVLMASQHVELISSLYRIKMRL